jgi:hypothetical protein
MMTTRALLILALSTVPFALLGCAPGGVEEDESEEAEDQDEEALTAAAFELPFKCGQVWSGQTRTNHSPLNSVDFNRDGDFGDTVVASAAGKVSRVDNEGNESYGRWIEIDHGDGYRTRYAHLSKQSVFIGQKVAKGQKIGEVGNSGGSFGSHLHFELIRNGSAIRPVFHGQTALFFGTKSYTSHNCGGGGGGGGGATGQVDTAGPSLTIRAQPNPNSAAVGSVDDGQLVTIKCQKEGASVTGTFGTSKLWDFIGTGYIADAYVATGSDGRVAPWCD